MNVARPRAFVMSVLILAGMAGLVLASVIRVASPDPWMIVSVLGATAVLELAPVRVNADVTAAMSVVVVFVAIAVGGIAAAVAAALAVGAASVLAMNRDRLIKTIYNMAMDVVAASLAAVAFALVARVPLVDPDMGAALQSTWRLTLGLLVAGLVYTVANAALLSLAVHLISGVPLGATALGMLQQILLLQFLYVGLSAVAYTLLVQAGPISLILVTVPLVVARRSLMSVQERQEAYDRMVRAFVKAIELKDGYTRGHAERVSDLSVLVAERMGLSYEDRQLIRYGAILHDVGKIGVSLGILCKAGPLDDQEFAEMKTHPEVGAAMLADIDFLKPALVVVHHHHERMDGRGYPAGLSGDEIPLLTRVVTAVDAFDAMTSTRSYRRALPIDVALEELQANAGTQFDSTVVGHLVAVILEQGWQITDEPVAVVSADSSHTSLVMP